MYVVLRILPKGCVINTIYFIFKLTLMRLKWKLENRSLSFRRIQVGNAITTQMCGRFTYRKCSCSNLGGCLHNISFKHDNWIHDAPPVQREPINEMMAWWNSNAYVEDERRGIRKRRAKRRKAHYGKGTVLSNLKHFITFELMSLMKT